MEILPLYTHKVVKMKWHQQYKPEQGWQTTACMPSITDGTIIVNSGNGQEIKNIPAEKGNRFHPMIII